MELLFVGWIIWRWVAVIAMCIFVAWALLYAVTTRLDGGRSESEARFLLKLWLCVPLSLLWPVALPALLIMSHSNLLEEANIEGPLARYERNLREREAAAKIAESKAVRERDKKIKMLEAQIRPGEVWYPPDWEHDRSVDPARRSR